MVTFEDVTAAAQRLRGVAHRTPVLTSETVDQRTGARVFFKCENFQRVGAFKIRGAYNALSRLASEQRARGVLTYSSGNHAQAVALAGRMLGAPVTVVMPADAPAVKVEATRGYGGEVVLYDRTGPTREEIGTRLAAERGLTGDPSVRPSRRRGRTGNGGDGAAGGGRAPRPAARALRRRGTPVRHRPGRPRPLSSCRVIGVEPASADDATRSFHTRQLQTVTNPDTIADGARTPSLGKITFPLVLELVHDMVTVSEDAIVSATLLLWNRMKLVVEPTGAMGAAALLDGVVAARGLRVGVILSGGNVDFEAVLARARTRA